MKKIISFLFILSTIIFIGCNNNITNSDDTNQGGNDNGNNNEITTPDGLASTYDGTWYFYSEDGKIKGDTVTVANGGITGLKTSSGTAIDFVKDNFNSKVIIDINLIDSKNYAVYKDGNTGNINFNNSVAYVKIKDASGAVIIEGMLSKTQKSTAIDASHAGTYTYTTTGNAKWELIVTADLVTFKRTSSSGSSETYNIPSVYFTKSGNSYTCDAFNYPNTVLNFDTKSFGIEHINVKYTANSDFSQVSGNSSTTTLSDSKVEYTKTK